VSPSRRSPGQEDSGGASSTSSPYVAAGPGPGFDPGKPPEHAEQRDELDGEELVEEWQREQVEAWLTNGGDLLHAAVGLGEHEWVMTQTDLRRIAPSATRILNRYQPTRAVAAFSDPMALAMGFGLYGWRSGLERVAELKARKERAEGQVTATGQGAPIVQSPPPAPQPGPPAPAVEDNGTPQPTWADQLKATRPPEEPSA
jgi:hypothetical protein